MSEPMRACLVVVALAGAFGTAGCGILEPGADATHAAAIVATVDSASSSFVAQIDVQNRGDDDLFRRPCQGIESRRGESWTNEIALSGGCPTVAPVRVPAHEFVRVPVEFRLAALPGDYASRDYRVCFSVARDARVAPAESRVVNTAGFSLR